MNDTPPLPERPILIAPERTGLLWLLTGISLTLNVVILIAILMAAIHHHHERDHQRMGGMGFRHHQGGMEMGRDGFHGQPGDENPGMNGGPEKDGHRGFDARGEDRHEFGGGMGRGMGMGGTPPSPSDMTDRVMDHLTKTLSLTEDEKTKIRPIVLDQVTQTQKDMEAQHQAMQKRMEDTKTKIKPFLTADQQKQLDALPVPNAKPADAPAAPAPAK